MTSRTTPLKGIRVVELGALVAAPYCGMLLADLGADVIKVEPPEGDMARRFAPFVEGGESAFFLSVNRGKRSVVVDLREEDGRRTVRELVATADVVLHNYRTGVAERLGLGYDDLREINPGLVYCAVSGFGPEGPMARRAGIDLLFQAESGMMAITGEPDGPPVKVGSNAADVYAATVASTTILAALVERATTGQGSRIDVSLRDAFLALQACWVTSFLATGEQPTRLGAASPFTAPTDVFPTADDSIVLAVVNDKHWRILCDVLDLPIAPADPRYVDNEARVRNMPTLRELVNEALAKRTTAEWLAAFDDAGIPAGQVLDYAGVVADEQIGFNEMILELDHETAGTVRVQGSPFWLGGEKPRLVVPPPVLGADTTVVVDAVRSADPEASPWR